MGSDRPAAVMIHHAAPVRGGWIQRVEVCGVQVSRVISVRCSFVKTPRRAVPETTSRELGSMKIATQPLVSPRRNASACRDHQVHVQGTLHYSRYPLLPAPGDPARGWGGRWVLLCFGLVWFAMWCDFKCALGESWSVFTHGRLVKEPWGDRAGVRLVSWSTTPECTLDWRSACNRVELCRCSPSWWEFTFHKKSGTPSSVCALQSPLRLSPFLHVAASDFCQTVSFYFFIICISLHYWHVLKNIDISWHLHVRLKCTWHHSLQVIYFGKDEA